VVALLLAGCASQPPAPETKAEVKKEPEKKEEPAPPPEAPKEPPKAAAVTRVKFETTKGSFIVEVHKDWAPIGAKRFLELVEDRFYDGSGFFRVVPNFVVQFGLAADPAKTRKWDKNLKDDPVIRTNALGTITFATAGPNTRTSQVFISLRSNQFLDDQGFAPFGKVSEGMDVVQKLTAEYGERPDQDAIKNRGSAYLKAQFPNLDMIKKASILTE